MLTLLTPAPPLLSARSKRAILQMTGRFEETKMTGSFSSESEGWSGSSDDSEKPDLDGLISGDRVLIKTENNFYQFSVTDAGLRQGRLSGGDIGDNARTAILVVSIRESADGRVSESSGLKIGLRAVFYFVSHIGMERLITSTVTHLTLIRNGKAWPLPVSSFNRKRPSPRTLIVSA